MSTKHPDAIDVHVGKRVRMRRNMMQLSQEKLAGELGITYQQQQKNERGFNRISVSRLFRLSQILKVPVDFFFDGVPNGGAHSAPTITMDFFAAPSGLALAEAFLKIKQPRARSLLVELAQELAADNAAVMPLRKVG